MSSSSRRAPIAIIGMAGRYPGGATSPERLWDLLVNGKDAIEPIKGDRWDVGWHHPDPQRQARIYANAAGMLDTALVTSFDAEFFGLSPREAAQVDPQQRLLLELAWEAHEDAGIPPRSRAGSQTGVFVGICSNDYAQLQGDWMPNAYTNTGGAASIASNRISYFFDFHGPSFSVDTACSSSLVAVHQACLSLDRGECEAALAGGVSILSDVGPWVGFAKANMLSPDGRCKSFDANGNGFVRAEGGGFVLLKKLADAERDGDRILGVIAASGVNSDGHTMGLSMPNGDAQEALLRQVYNEAGIAADEVFYVEAHGPGTAVGDPIECGAIGRVLGAPRGTDTVCRIGSVKSNIGHLEGASGIAGLTKLLLCLRHRTVPANLHFETPNPKIDFDGWKLRVVDQLTPFPDQPVVVGINSFGFGGTNAHLAIREYRPAARPAAIESTGGAELLVLHGQSEGAVRDLAHGYAARLEAQSSESWSELCAATNTTRSPLRHRLALLAGSREEAVARLRAFLDGAAVARLACGQSAGVTVPVAFVYSGNGPQWWGMGRELLAENAAFRAELEAVDAIFAPLSGWSLLAEMQRPEAENRIAQTEVAQPLLFALQVGLTRVLRDHGIVPQAVLGHSVGEVAAAYASGALTLEQATQVIYHRSQEQGKTAGLGRMAALGIDAAEAAEAMARVPGWLELAAVNSPRAVTVAGDPAALEKLVEQVTAAGKFARILPLNYAFHTRAMEPISAPLEEALKQLAPRSYAVPFVSTVEGVTVDGTLLDARYWYRNVREPVQFAGAVTEAVTRHGAAVLLEIGPHPVLKDYVADAVKAAGAQAMALGTLRRPGSKGPEPETDNLFTAICAAVAHGAADPAQRYRGTRRIEPSLPLYPWQRTRHWRGTARLPGATAPVEWDHPLLGFRLRSRDGLWENPVDLNRLPYLAGHVVQASVLFPAAGYVEMGLAAARRLLGDGPLDLENFEILRPFPIPAGTEPHLQLAMDAQDATVEIRSRASSLATEWTAHLRTRASRVERSAEPLPVKPLELLARMHSTVGGAEHYADCRGRGMDYGPDFQGVMRVGLTAPEAERREAMAEIALPWLPDSALAGYLAHPAVLDSCIQVLITLVAQTEKRACSTIPVYIDRVRSFHPLPALLFCHVKMRRESSRSVVADFALLDGEGRLLMEILGARAQKVDFQSGAATPLLGEAWRPCSLQAVPYAAPPAPAPAPAVVAGAAAVALPVPEAMPDFNALVAAYAAHALAALHPGGGAFDLRQLARQGGVKRDQTKKLGQLVELAAAHGLLQSQDSRWVWTEQIGQQDPQAMWRALFLAHPRHQAELLAIAETCTDLVAQLRGEAKPELGHLFEQLHDQAPVSAAHHAAAHAVLSALMPRWPALRPLRILEVGAAGAALASLVQPALETARAEYLFTHPEEAVVARAEHRLAAHAAARCRVLDSAVDWTTQGVAAGWCDLVIVNPGAPVEDREALLEAMRPALAADAQILVFEEAPGAFHRLVLKRPEGGPWPAVLSRAGFGAAADAGPARLAGRENGVASTATPAAAERRTFGLLGEKTETLAALLGSRGHSVVNGMAPGEVVFVCGPVPLDETAARLLALAELTRTMQEENHPGPLTLVTFGAWATAAGEAPLDPAQATLWGMGRVIANEQARWRVRMIDVHGAADSADCAAWLAAELERRDDETEVQLAHGFRYVNRHRFLAASAPAGEGDGFQLDFLPQGGLDSLHLRRTARRAPAAGQVEIAVRAAGLNFRDVLWAMGMLPEEAVEHGFSGPTIGMECAGEVVRTGEGVTHVRPGDRVVAFASHCFGSHVTTDAGSTAAMPATLSYAEAATIPTVFLTAYYALDYLARLEPGETVLIHGAAGGVGLAALQIAKWKGARVIGTAGSPRKRRMLELLGADHVLNSRSLEFADEVRHLTGGVGVDVVLNSLAGEAITKSLQCLRPFGRFLEIGKRDLYANSRIGLRPFRNNLSYFGIDADTLLIDRAGLAQRLFQQVMDLFAAGQLRPIAFQTTPIARASEAFRAMQQSRHVGKLVLTVEPGEGAAALPVPNSAGCRVEAGVTYLVTGGLGGFGLASAEWLAAQGATSLALVSRRGAVTEEALQGLARLQAKGVNARAFACDVADATAVHAMIAEIRATMPPLAGVFHAAAVIEDAPIHTMSAEQIARVLSPKVQGTWNLHQATLADPLQMFVLYSSTAACIGSPGQAAYSAANLYMEALAMDRVAQGRPALSVGWGAIKDAGFLTRHENVAEMLKARTGLDATPVSVAMADLERMLAGGRQGRVTAGRVDFQRLATRMPAGAVPRFSPILPKDLGTATASDQTLAELLPKTPVAEQRALVCARLLEHAARVLGTGAAQINPDQALGELGLDSLMAVELAGAIERDLGRAVSVMQVLSAGSLSAIADQLLASASAAGEAVEKAA